MIIKQGTSQQKLLIICITALAIGVLVAVGAAGAQTNSADCYHRNGGRYVVVGQRQAADCALSIYSDGDVVNGHALGGWGRFYLAVNEGGDVYYSRDARRWRLWDTITVASTDVPPAEAPNGIDDDGDGVPNANDQCLEARETYNGVFDTDGCPDDVHTLLNWAADDLNAFWSAEFAEADIPYYEPRRVTPYRSTSRRSGAYNAYYSLGSHSIAYDINLMNDVLRAQGDLAPVYILAHEWGHLVQGNLNRFAGRATVVTEQEADCLAGAYVQNLEERGLLEEGDFDEGVRQAWAVGDNLPDTHPGAHGSPRERATAFTLGFEQGADGCFSEYG